MYAKTETSFDKMNNNSDKIKKLINDGMSVNQIIRTIGVTTDYTLRKWIKFNLSDDLIEKVMQNGSRRRANAGVK